MQRFFHTILLGAGLLCATNAMAAHHSIHDYTAKYQVSYAGIPVGKSTRQLSTSNDGRYTLTVDGRDSIPFFSVRTHERSLGTWQGTRIKPESYQYKYRRKKKHKHTELKFDWRQMKTYDVVNHRTWPAKLPQKAYDNLSYQLAMRQDILNGKKKLSYKVMRHGRVKTYTFQIIGEENIKTKLGLLNTLVVQRVKEKGTWTKFWLARDFDYLLVRLEHHDDGSKSIGEIVSASFPESQGRA